MKVDVNLELECTGCPAKYLQTPQQLEKVKGWEAMRVGELKKIGSPLLFLLCESIPNDRFIYDRSSNYQKDGLRYNLRKEFVKGCSDEDLFQYLRLKKILVADCAFCPLHRLPNNKLRREAATVCISRHNYKGLEVNSDAPIIKIFPSHCGYKKTIFTCLEYRVIGEFRFQQLYGLKNMVESKY